MKKSYLELLRILAIVFVLFNHTNTYGFFYFPYALNTFEYVASLTLSILCKVAVPIFFMISGSLLLAKEDSLKIIITKRIGRIFIVLFLFCVLTDSYFDILNQNPGIHLRNNIKTMWRGDIATYWFLYSYLSLMIILPFLQKMIKQLKQEHFLYLLASQILLVQVMPTLLFLMLGYHMQTSLNVAFWGENIFYFLMGYYIDNFCSKRYEKKKFIFIDFFLFLSTIVLSAVMTYFEYLHTGEYSETYLSLFLPLPVLIIFNLTKHIISIKNLPTTFVKIIFTLGSTSFCVYLLEPIGRNLFLPIFKLFLINMSPLSASLLFTLFLAIVLFIIAYLLKKLPIFRQLL